MKHFILIFFALPSLVFAEEIPITAIHQSKDGVYFSKKNISSNASFLVRRTKIRLREIANVNGLSWVRATMKTQRRSLQEMEQLPSNLLGRHFVAHSLTARSNCSFHSSMKSKIRSLSQPSDIKGNSFSGENTEICNFSFAVPIDEDFEEVVEQIKKEAKENTLVQIQFEKLDFKVYREESLIFDLEEMAENIINGLPEIDRQLTDSAYATFIWGHTMLSQQQNWESWKATKASHRPRVLGQLYEALFKDFEDNQVLLRDPSEISETPTLSHTQYVFDREVIYVP